MKPERIRYMRDYFRDYLPSATMRIASRLAHEVLDDIERLQAEVDRLRCVVLKTEKMTEAIELLEEAWGVIANAGTGDWLRETPEWQEAAAKWRDRYHARLRAIVEKGTE